MPETDQVDRAFARVHRRDFLPASQRRFAGQDSPLPIGHGQTNSQPSTVRGMLRLLDARPGHRVLDVGCGSGWTTALLGELVGPEGEVLGLEIVPALVEQGRANLLSYPRAWTRIEAADPDRLGRPDEGPWDRILVSAEAPTLPAGLVDQLVAGGLMVVPVAGRMNVVQRTPVGPPEVRREGHYAFVPLIEPR